MCETYLLGVLAAIVEDEEYFDLFTLRCQQASRIGIDGRLEGGSSGGAEGRGDSERRGRGGGN